MLAARLTPELLATLAEPGTWRWWPSARDTAAWERVLTPERRTWILEQAEAARAAGWPAVPATLYLDCTRTGNRVRGEAVIFTRRQQLGAFVTAYAATRDAAWLDASLDALWSICEESTWCIPAHARNHRPETHPGLPLHDVPVVDLFAAETASVVSDALDILRDDLAEIDSSIVPRIVHELRTRVVDPVTVDDGWGWLNGKNNWSPWIVSNAGRVVLAHARDRAGLDTVVTRFLTTGDRFLANYGEDGGCDEGMRYWGVAFGTLFLFLEELHAASGGRIALFDHPQFAALGTFPVNAHLGGRWFLPFADNLGTGSVRGALGVRVAERLQLPALRWLAELAARNWDPAQPAAPLRAGGNGSNLQDLLWQLFWTVPGTEVPQVEGPSRTWLESLQVLAVRTPGLVLAVKGGHNEENHNHNDVGCVHVLKAGKPVVVDPGVEAYSMKTFGPERYDIWCIRGSGHNAPVIDGHEQQFGRRYEACDTRVWSEGPVECFETDLAACYDEEAIVRRALRTVRFDTVGQRIEVSDIVEADREFAVTTTWFATEDPRGGRFRLEFPRAEVVIVEQPLEDAGLRESWQTESLWRITATVRGRGRVEARLVII